MGVTVVRAGDRQVRAAPVRRRSLDRRDALLVAASAVALLAMALAYEGRIRTAALDAGGGPAPVDLRGVTAGTALEPVLEPILPGAADRRAAAAALARLLSERRDSGAGVPNVGTLSGARLPVSEIERSPGLVEYAARLEQARAAAAARGRPAPDSLPVLTAADLAAIKPGLVVRTRARFAAGVRGAAAAWLLPFYLVALFWYVRRVDGDRVLLAAAHLLTGLGFALLLARPDPLRDTVLVARYAEGVAIGAALLGAASLVDLSRPVFSKFTYVPLVTALSLSLVLIAFGSGPGASGAKVNLGPVQPIEAIRLLLALFLAGYFARRWELVRQVEATRLHGRAMPSWLSAPKIDYVLPVAAGVGTALLLLYLQKDLGPALFLWCVFLALYGVARGRWPMAAAGAVLLFAAFALAYTWQLSATLVERVGMWLAPWDNAVGGGDQVAQSIWAMATGGPAGTGLGLGATRYLPAGHTDLMLAAAGEELGLAGLVALAILYAVVAWRGFRAAVRSGSDYGLFAGVALTLFLTVPVLVMAAGLVGAIPLTGVVTPFLSYGGSAMAANCAALGLLCGLGRRHAAAAASALAMPFVGPVRALRGVLGAGAVALVGAAVYVQAVDADALAVRPHLSRQADGVRRYQYNPRVLDVLRDVPRGSVYDRSGLVLATGDRALVRASRDAYAALGLSLDPSCVSGRARCYPLGGETFHVLGDVTSRVNWSATNSSYVERDRESALRGFDDRATSVPSSDAEGRRVYTLRRDYQSVVPLLRHRFDPDHPAVAAVRARDRDVRLTIDAALQHRVSSILAAHAARSGAGRAAAVVLDPATGEILAAASYPWPTSGERAGRGSPSTAPGVGDGALLDRARYGLYPPGSAFKLVTATAALRRDLSLAQASYTCGALPGGRVGTRVAGGRPVRDDVLDRRPHGTIGMHEGLVHSCNAYFAQLALRLGPEALLETAARLGISVVGSNPTASHLRATLPQAGYGQGEVLTTPLRMARVAAAIAGGGILRDARLEASEARARDEVLLPPDAARLLGDYMRDAVLEGTGRTLAGHPARIAGKTGTAEVSGAPSHAWFVGYAPHGAAERRVAFAVLVEHAGYGGRAAAPVAGAIVTAAAARGYVR